MTRTRAFPLVDALASALAACSSTSAAPPGTAGPDAAAGAGLYVDGSSAVA